MEHPKYRPDVDGLRAVAVLSVVGFHAFPSWVRGGYVGVDIFFVISGYLISIIIFSSLERDSFSVLGFYNKRVRRIFPSLLTILLFSLVFGWDQLTADEYGKLGWDVAGGATFSSNFLSWRETGYFDRIAELKPMLHLWSLAIEEQFYILWPLLLALVWKRRLSFWSVTVVIGTVSLVGSILLTNSHPTAAFYAPMTRAWELMLGGALAYVSLHQPDLLQANGDRRSLAGLVLIVVSVVLLRRGIPYPGWYALLPTLGAALLISAGPGALVNRRLLSARFLVGIGLISYPLYLWHWMLLSLAHITTGELGTPLILLLIAAAFAFAIATYVLIERPLRFARYGATAPALLATLMATGIVGFLIFAHGGLEFRPVAQRFSVLNWRASYSDTSSCLQAGVLVKFDLTYCVLPARGTAEAFIIGDSHAYDKYYGIKLADRTRRWAVLGNAGCPPLYGVNFEGEVHLCEEKSEAIIDWVATSPEARTVVVSFFSRDPLTSDFAADDIQQGWVPERVRITSKTQPGLPQAELFYLGLKRAVDVLVKAGKEVILLVDIPELPFLPEQCLRDERPCAVSRQDISRRQELHRRMLSRLVTEFPTVKVFDPTTLFCDESSCTFEHNGLVVYHNSHHLSLNGSALYGRMFVSWLREFHEQ